MTKIINLIGASGAGKTTIAKLLDEKGYNIIHSFTTREPREENEWGHIFINDWYPVYVNNGFVGIENDGDPDLTDKGISHLYNKQDYKYIDIDNMIAYFNNYDKNEHYFATDNQIIRDAINIYIVDPSGAEQVKNFYQESNIEVTNVFLAADERSKKWRLVRRHLDNLLVSGEIDNWLGEAELYANKRIKRDEEIFRTVKTDYVIDANREIEEVLSNVIDVIGRMEE